MNSFTVKQLAEASSRPIDEVLLQLWYSNLYEVEDSPQALIPPSKISLACEAVGITYVEPIPDKKISWWLDFLGMPQKEFFEILSSLGFRISGNKVNLPKGAYRKLEQKFENELRPHFLGSPLQKSDIQVVGDEILFSAPEVEIIGTRGEIIYLTYEEVIQIHELLEDKFETSNDPISPPGIKNMQMLDSAINRPILANIKYPTVEMASAALMHSVIKNHAFHNGNKRTGVVSLLVMLDRNNLKLIATESELFAFAYQVASSDLLEHPRHRYKQVSDHETLAMAHWIKEHTKPYPPDAKVRNLKWGELRARLANFGCKFETSRGNIVVSRPDPELNSKFFSTRPKVLKSILKSVNARPEIDKSEIQDLRKRLKLDSSFVSNGEFFNLKNEVTSDFIQVYSKVLNRLAKM